ncbi:MAG: polyprenyl-phospho-N-acetylgalactosaminyl synthase [Variibacter sp.]|nr:polyprenyl-phospho-N-acetylgalactosaminyl synthase [Variibacter sp.]
MSETRDVFVVIAAYNEGAVIGDVIASLRRSYSRVIVVDDGSHDETAARARDAGALVIEHPINLGQGAALQTGLDYALKAGAAFIATFDADGQHRVEDIEVLLQALKTGEADFALGSRFLGAAVNAPLSRRLLLRAATVFTRLTTGLRISDAHNGLRAMTARGARALRIRQNRMAHASELLHQIATSGLKYVEAPVTIDYTEYSLAKGQRVSDALTVLMDLVARRLHR